MAEPRAQHGIAGIIRAILIMGAAGLLSGGILAVMWPDGPTAVVVAPTEAAQVSPEPGEGGAAPATDIPATEAVHPSAPPSPKTAQPTPAPPPTPVVDEPTPDPTQGATPASAEDGAVLHAFPIVPSTAASYGREHHDYPATDIFAECGLDVVAPVAGEINEITTVDRWDPAVNDPATRGGLSIAIVGDDGVRHYMSHLGSFVEGLSVGTRLTAGSTIGTVGRTGNAAPTPCHVHFGLSPPRGPGDSLVRRGVIWPWPYLDGWRAGDLELTAREEIDEWATNNPQ